MERISRKKVSSFLLGPVVVVSLLLACSGADDEGLQPSGTPTTEVPEKQEPVVIIIGNHTDMTGVASNAISVVDMALDDMVTYYNDHHLVPGVELKVTKYDGAFDPSKTIPGYKWLRERGADVIWTPVGATAPILKPFVDEDEIPLFTVAANRAELGGSPGYVFCPGSAWSANQSYTALKWIIEYDIDFPTDRPAKIGGTLWNEPNGEAHLTGLEEYAKAHPEKYEWIGGYLPDFTFNWSAEVEQLKECDYLLAPAPAHAFAQQYRDAGYMAKFIGTDSHTAFLGMIDEGDLWNEIDGMLVIRPGRWWNEEGEIISLIKEVLYEYRPEEADSIVRKGSGYLAADTMYVMLELIKNAVAAVGPENFSSRNIYNAAKSYSLTVNEIERDTFSETKRASRDYLAMYEIRANEKNLFRVGPEYYPVVSEP